MKEFDLDVYSGFQDEITTTENKNVKKNTTSSEPPKWQESLGKLTDFVKEYGGAYSEQKAPVYSEGKKVRKFGMHPLVFVAVSLGLVIAGSITLVYLGRKKTIK
jgi:hypothetical protein